ncbi:hypothetical protein [Halomonas sp. OfavH-34-E]|nr:hypothetical protein [Halomonas sp. OfavH-34-E]MCO7217107.1 hypothetical protein [Halomonas sp. OfavH-34-E]
MSDTDYNIVARTPLARIRDMPVEQLAAFLERCAPLTRQALDRIFKAQ